MSEQQTAEALYRMILWVPQSDRDLMIADLAETVSPEAAEQVSEWYKVHAINGSE